MNELFIVAKRKQIIFYEQAMLKALLWCIDFFFFLVIYLSASWPCTLTVNFCCSDNVDSNRMLENSLNAKEKLISELNMELHNIETTLSSEREEHMNDVKKLTAMLNEKVMF